MLFLVGLAEKTRGLISRIEGKKLPFSHWLYVFYGILVLRGILEGILVDPERFPRLVTLFVHWPLWYFNLFISTTFVLFLFTHKRIEKITKLVISFSLIILLVPLFDFWVSQGRAPLLGYATSLAGMLGMFTSLGGIIGESIITPGQSITIWTAILSISIFMLLKKKGVIKALLAGFSFYLLIVLYASFPMALSFVSGIPLSARNNALRLVMLFLVTLAVIQSTIWLYFYNKKAARAVFGGLRPWRIFHYSALTTLGALYSLHVFSSVSLHVDKLLAAVLSVFLWFEFCLVYNNIYDGQIPKNISRKQYRAIGFAMLLFSFLFAIFTNALVVVLLFLVMVIGFCYSVPPLRLKRLGFLNNVVIGFLSMLVAGIGFLSQNPNPTTIQLNASLAILITFSLAANIKDLKDYKTDKKEGIKTLPVLLGEEKGLKAIALLSSISFVIPPILLGYPNLTIIGTLFGLANYYLLNKTKKETTTFYMYFLFAIVVAVRMLIWPF